MDKEDKLLSDASEIKVKSLQKAIEVLNCFSKKQPLGVSEISQELGLYKSNVYNILSTFRAMEYLEQDEETGKYRLGAGVFALCRALSDSFNITDIAIPHMREIGQKIKEIIYLAVPHEDDVIYLQAIYPAEAMRPARPLLGERHKMYCTSVGKAMLAQLDDKVMEEYISRPLKPFTDYTITDKEALRRDLLLTRKRGYSFDNMEIEYGVKCVGVPIFNRKGKVEAAMSISCPSLRMSEARIPVFVRLLQEAALEIQKKL